MNDATMNAITVVNLARCMISCICGYYKRPRPAASLAGREVGQSDGGGCGDRRDRGQEDWAKDAPTDAAANQKRFGDETSEHNGVQKRTAGCSHAGSENDEKEHCCDKDAGRTEKRRCA